MVTMKDIANKLGVAVSTVSKGLNGANDISDDLRQTILDTAVEMGYTPKCMKKETQKKICIFIENMHYENPDDFGHDIILGFRQMALRENWNVTIISIDAEFQAKENYDTYMLKNGYSGSLLLGLALHDDWMKQLKTSTTPSVLFDNYVSKNPHVSYIGTDSFEGIDLCVTHLAELGHKNIAMLNGTANSMVTVERIESFYQSMKQNQLDVDDSMVTYGDFVAGSAKKYVSFFIEKGATAIVCASDAIASDVMDECERLGYHVPEDISVTGFDDLPFATHLTPPLTTIRQDRLYLGKSSYNTLMGLIASLPISKTLMRAELIRRSTTAPVKPRSVQKTSRMNIQKKEV